MKKKNAIPTGSRWIWIVLFWGALWGLAEATLGFVLHAAAAAIPGIQGFVMFPIAFVLMERAVAASGKPWAAFAASWIAAGVKMADFLIPGAVPLRVLNPALALLLEGFVVWGVLAWCGRSGVRVNGWHALAASLLWRGLFLGDQGVLALCAIPAGLVTNGWEPALRFLLLEGAVNALLIWGWLALPWPARSGAGREPGRSESALARIPLPVWSGSLLTLAFVAQLLF